MSVTDPKYRSSLVPPPEVLQVLTEGFHRPPKQPPAPALGWLLLKPDHSTDRAQLKLHFSTACTSWSQSILPVMWDDGSVPNLTLM